MYRKRALLNGNFTRRLQQSRLLQSAFPGMKSRVFLRQQSTIISRIVIRWRLKSAARNFVGGAYLLVGRVNGARIKGSAFLLHRRFVLLSFQRSPMAVYHNSTGVLEFFSAVIGSTRCHPFGNAVTFFVRSDNKNAYFNYAQMSFVL